MAEHTILATDPSFGTISVCPGGIVHIDLHHLSLKFVPSDFGKLADLVGKARARLGTPPQAGTGKPRLQVVREVEETSGGQDSE